MANDISRRLLLKLAAATGATLAMPPVVHAALVEEKESIPVFEYFDGSKWVELGGVLDTNVKVTIEQIEQGFGRPPMRGMVTTEVAVDYFSGCGHDPFAKLDRDRFDIRVRVDCLGKIHRFSCAQALAVSYSVSSNGKVQAVLLSGGFPEMTIA